MVTTFVLTTCNLPTNITQVWALFCSIKLLFEEGASSCFFFLFTEDVTLIVVPGICNTSESDYIRTFVNYAQNNGYRCAVLNHVGVLPNVPVTGRRIFTYGKGPFNISWTWCSHYLCGGNFGSVYWMRINGLGEKIGLFVESDYEKSTFVLNKNCLVLTFQFEWIVGNFLHLKWEKKIDFSLKTFFGLIHFGIHLILLCFVRKQLNYIIEQYLLSNH